jgi:hypothetical protein
MCWNTSDFSQSGGLCWPYTSNSINLLNMPFVNENSYSIFILLLENIVVIAEVYLWHLYTFGCVEICLLHQLVS